MPALNAGPAPSPEPPLSLASSHLLIRSGQRRCVLPLAAVVEIARPRPLASLGELPPFVLGLLQLRGEAVPVVDLRLLLGDPLVQGPAMLVCLRLLKRRIALAVDQVLGLVAVPLAVQAGLPPLLEAGSPAVEALAIADFGLVLMLRSASLFPLESGGAA